MLRFFRLLLLMAFCFSIFLYQGCNTKTGIDNGSTANTSPSATESPYWIEVQGRFYTNDITRAQAEIPIPILLPTYNPKHEYASLPMIDGPLRISSDDAIEINIKYCLYLGNDITVHIFITERNRPILPGGGNTIEIAGIVTINRLRVKTIQE